MKPGSGLLVPVSGRARMRMRCLETLRVATSIVEYTGVCLEASVLGKTAQFNKYRLKLLHTSSPPPSLPLQSQPPLPPPSRTCMRNNRVLREYEPSIRRQQSACSALNGVSIAPKRLRENRHYCQRSNVRGRDFCMVRVQLTRLMCRESLRGA